MKGRTADQPPEVREQESKWPARILLGFCLLFLGIEALLIWALYQGLREMGWL